jgi:hypothetical protein
MIEQIGEEISLYIRIILTELQMERELQRKLWIGIVEENQKLKS